MSGPYGSYYIDYKIIRHYSYEIETYACQHLQGLWLPGVRKNVQIMEDLW